MGVQDRLEGGLGDPQKLPGFGGHHGRGMRLGGEQGVFPETVPGPQRIYLDLGHPALDGPAHELRDVHAQGQIHFELPREDNIQGGADLAFGDDRRGLLARDPLSGLGKDADFSDT